MHNRNSMRSICTYARKHSIPENCMNVDWVFEQLERLETRDSADFSFWSKSKSSDTTTTHTSSPATASAAKTKTASTTPPASNDFGDFVEIKCKSQHTGMCENNFKTQPEYWKSKGMDTPKSCYPCRKHNRHLKAASTSSCVTSEPALPSDYDTWAIPDSDSDEYPNATDDYMEGFYMSN